VLRGRCPAHFGDVPECCCRRTIDRFRFEFKLNILFQFVVYQSVLTTFQCVSLFFWAELSSRAYELLKSSVISCCFHCCSRRLSLPIKRFILFWFVRIPLLTYSLTYPSSIASHTSVLRLHYSQLSIFSVSFHSIYHFSFSYHSPKYLLRHLHIVTFSFCQLKQLSFLCFYLANTLSCFLSHFHDNNTSNLDRHH